MQFSVFGDKLFWSDKGKTHGNEGTKNIQRGGWTMDDVMPIIL